MNLYHGSFKEFEKFSLEVKKRFTNNETNNLGIWLTNSKEVAKGFTIKHYSETKESKTEFWNDGTPKVYLEDKFYHGGIYTVKCNDLNLKVYEINDSMISEYEKKLNALEKEVKELDKEFKSIKDKIYLDYEKHYIEYHRIIELLSKKNKELRILRYKNIKDSFDMFMFDRDQFCKYISDPKGEVSWKERYILMNKEEANTEFIEYLKNDGYDGFIIKDTVYDSEDDKPIDQICVFNIEKLEIQEFENISNILNEKEILELEIKAVNSISIF